MTKPVLAFYGNCISACLVEIFSEMPALAETFEIAGTTHLWEFMPESTMARAALLVTQDRLLGSELPPPEQRALLPRDCPVLRVPNLVLSSLWPLNCRDPRDVPDALNPFGRHAKPRTDKLALEILRTVPDPEARRSAYLATDIHTRIDLGRFHEIQAEQLVEMERNCDVRVAAHVLTTFRRQRLFFAAHHPTPALLLFLIAQIFIHPRFAPFRTTSVQTLLDQAARALAAKRPFEGEQVPIHPAIAEYFGLEWWSPQQRYRIDEREFSFEEWLDYYMADPLPGS